MVSSRPETPTSKRVVVSQCNNGKRVKGAKKKTWGSCFWGGLKRRCGFWFLFVVFLCVSRCGCFFLVLEKNGGFTKKGVLGTLERCDPTCTFSFSFIFLRRVGPWHVFELQYLDGLQQLRYNIKLGVGFKHFLCSPLLGRWSNFVTEKADDEMQQASLVGQLQGDMEGFAQDHCHWLEERARAHNQWRARRTRHFLSWKPTQPFSRSTCFFKNNRLWPHPDGTWPRGLCRNNSRIRKW